jgi:hypothetical protein
VLCLVIGLVCAVIGGVHGAWGLVLLGVVLVAGCVNHLRIIHSAAGHASTATTDTYLSELKPPEQVAAIRAATNGEWTTGHFRQKGLPLRSSVGVRGGAWSACRARSARATPD